MNIDNIIFENDDTKKQTIEKTVLFWAGSPNELKNQLKKIGITNYSKVQRGLKTTYVVRTKDLQRIEIKL